MSKFKEIKKEDMLALFAELNTRLAKKANMAKLLLLAGLH